MKKVLPLVTNSEYEIDVIVDVLKRAIDVVVDKQARRKDKAGIDQWDRVMEQVENHCLTGLVGIGGAVEKVQDSKFKHALILWAPDDLPKAPDQALLASSRAAYRIALAAMAVSAEDWQSFFEHRGALPDPDIVDNFRDYDLARQLKGPHLVLTIARLNAISTWIRSALEDKPDA